METLLVVVVQGSGEGRVLLGVGDCQAETARMLSGGLGTPGARVLSAFPAGQQEGRAEGHSGVAYTICNVAREPLALSLGPGPPSQVLAMQGLVLCGLLVPS